MKQKLILVLSLVAMAMLSVSLTSCSSDDGGEEDPGYSGNLSSLLTQYGWESDYNYDYLFGDDYIYETRESSTLFFLGNGSGIMKYYRRDYDTDFGSSSSTEAIAFAYSVSGSSVTIRREDMSTSITYKYQNERLFSAESYWIYKKNSITSSDRKWLEGAQYEVLPDNERLDIEFEHSIEPIRSYNGNYYYYLHIGVPASSKANLRKISTLKAEYTIPGIKQKLSNELIIDSNKDCSKSIMAEVKESLLPTTIYATFYVWDSKTGQYEKIGHTEYELTANGGVNDDNTSGNNDTPSSTGKTFTANGVSFKIVYVQGGTFTMGATSEQGSDAYSHEKPTHSVTLSSYYMGETEVTQALWEAVMGSNPSYFKGDSSRPVEQVSWEDCQTFLSKLNSLTGQQFHLPTEAQWEYAARGGSKSRGYKYSGSNDIGSVAWYSDNSSSATHPVKTKQPNELGLYDMSGNVYEWCQDWWGSYSSSSQTNPTGASSGSDRVRRGGSWGDDARYCRVSYRGSSTPSFRGGSLGLRLAL